MLLLYFTLYALTLVCTGVTAVTTVNWIIMGEIETLLGIIVLFMTLVVAFFVIVPPIPGTSIIFALTIILYTCFVPTLKEAMNKYQLDAIDYKQTKLAYDRLKANPLALSNVLLIAESAYARGLIGPAIRMMESAIPQLPAAMTVNEVARLKSWQRQSPSHEQFRPHACQKCGIQNEPEQIFCRRCGHEFWLDYMFVGIAQASPVRRAFQAWIAVSGALIAVTVLGPLAPFPLNLVVYAVALGVATAMVIRLLVRSGGTAA